MSLLNRRLKPALSLAVGVGSNSLIMAGVPLTAMLLLLPADFGSFSVLQLMVGLGGALTFSVVSEPWSRLNSGIEGRPGVDGAYFRVLAITSLISAMMTLAASLILPELRGTWLWAAFLGASSGFRIGSRYRMVYSGHPWRAVSGDCLGIAVIVLCFIWTSVAGRVIGLDSVVAIWCLGTVASAIPFSKLLVPRVSAVRLWARVYSREMRFLLSDSAITDIGGVGSQLAMAPVLGIYSFGVFRSLSNSAAPVRLIVGPLRPVLARLEPGVLHRGRVVVGLMGVIVLISGGVAVVLDHIAESGLELGTFSVLAEYGLIAAFFVGGSVALHTYSALGRISATGFLMLRARTVQTIIYGVAPLLFGLLWGLQAAMIAAAVATWASALIWFLVSRPRSSGDYS